METVQLIKAFSQIQPFAQLEAAVIQRLYAELLIHWHTLEKGQVLHMQNEICDHLDVIIEGQIAIQNIDADGNLLTIQVFSDRDLLGANLIFSSRNRYPMLATAQQKSIVAHVPRQLILDLCRQNEAFMTSLLQSISDRSILLTDKIQSIALKSIRKSLIEFLQYESAIQNSRQVKLSMSKKDLAERFGVERTSLSRELDKMRRDGLVVFDARSITLLESVQ
ncbi:MAG: Crp/Fnr family transcriptional regulator [Eubacteriales bacterium]|nr:Crp/Fnr family transcriptional regulator [Eubacteriales bacterium]